MFKLAELAHQDMNSIQCNAPALADVQALERLRMFREEEQGIICQVWKSRGGQSLKLR